MSWPDNNNLLRLDFPLQGLRAWLLGVDRDKWRERNMAIRRPPDSRPLWEAVPGKWLAARESFGGVAR
jgi:hypothetical protein